MPYKDVSELPSSVKDVLPEHAQSIFMAAFNSAFKSGKDEETCFKIAWGAVKKSYKKVGDMWEEMKNMQTLAMFMNVEIINANHEAILQTLNRDIGGYYFPAEVFANNVQDWSEIPIIYATNHPDVKLFVESPQLALDKIKGRIVGKVTMPRVDIAGHPRLMGNMDITDQEINRFISEGKISHSTGFIGTVDGKNVTSVTPNHVLVFLEDATNLPKDRGAFILNKQELQSSPNNEGLNNTNMESNQMTEDKVNELTQQLEISNKEKETLTGEIDGLKQIIADKDVQLKVFAQKEADALKVTRENQWQTIKKSIPGPTHKAEDEQKLRTEFEADPYGFAVKLTEFKNKELPGKEGVEFAQQELDADAKDEQDAIAELREVGGMNRRRSR
jgi:cation transport regulator